MTRLILCAILLMLPLAPPAHAHSAPTSFLDVRLTAQGIDVTLQASATDFSHDLPTVEPDMLMTAAVAEAQRATLTQIALSRLTLTADGRTLTGEAREITPVPDRKDVRLRLFFACPQEPKSLQIACRLFPYDPRHKTYLNVFQDGRLERQAVFDADENALTFQAGSRQAIGAVIAQFIREGMHHIFIGPDHILFIIGLLLLGGTWKQLLKIVTAFTIAHSITLTLATLNIVNPPPRIIEPMIALSIVFVGVNSLTSRGARDPRLLFAFCFGFIHGFGFANALRAMELPRYALGWSLFSFNIGVEMGQMCIVLAVAPILAALRTRRPALSRRVVAVGSLAVIGAGAFWFVQRAFFGG